MVLKIIAQIELRLVVCDLGSYLSAAEQAEIKCFTVFLKIMEEGWKKVLAKGNLSIFTSKN